MTLQLNGHELPLAKCDPKSSTGAKFKRSASGIMAGVRSWQKRVYSIQTTWQREIAHRAYDGLLLGRGTHVGFNETEPGSGTAKTSASSGLVPTTDAGTEPPSNTVPVVDTGGTGTHAKYGNGCLHAFATSTNLFTTGNVRNGDEANDRSGFTAVGSAALSQTTAAGTFLQGAAALQCVTTAATSDGFYAAQTGLSNGTVYYASVYIRAASGTESVRVRLWDTDNGYGTAVTLSATTNFQRVLVSQTCGATGTMRLYVDTPDATVRTFYCDALQLEAGGHRIWNDAAATTATDLRFETDLAPHDDFTLMGWFRKDASLVSDQHWLFFLGDSSNGIGLSSNDTTMDGDLYSGGGVDQAWAGVGTDPWPDNDWIHIAVVMRRNPGSGEAQLNVYVDGDVNDTDTSGFTLPVWTSPPTLQVGADKSQANQWDGYIQDLVLLPFALTDEIVSDFYGFGEQFSPLPHLKAGGEPFNNVTTLVLSTAETQTAHRQGTVATFEDLYSLRATVAER